MASRTRWKLIKCLPQKSLKMLSDVKCALFQNAELKFNFGDTPFKHPPQVVIYSVSYFINHNNIIVHL